MTIHSRALRPAVCALGLMLCACGGGMGNQAARDTDVVLPAGVTQLTFPQNFLFGTASAAYQCEGAWNQGGRGYTDWDMLTQVARMANGETGNVADDFYDLYPEDVALMAKMGVRSFRFSIAWSRIYPTGFPFQLDPVTYQPVLDASGQPIPVPPNPDGVAFYNNLINLLLQNGITPLVTLYHWDMPIMLWEMGGFNNRTVVDMFAAYAQTVFQLYGDRVTYWLTLNEPYGECVMLEGLIGWAMAQAAEGKTVTLSSMMASLKVMPGEQLLGQQMTYLHNYLYASGLACEIYHGLEAQNLVKPGMIGPVLDVHVAHPSSDSPADVAATKLYNDANYGMEVLPLLQGAYPQDVIAKLNAEGYAWTLPQSQITEDLEMMSSAGRPDFIGVNYYSTGTVTSTPTNAMFPSFGALGSGPMFNEAYPYSITETPESANGPYDPQGLYDTLARLDQDSNHLPMIITENGCSYPGEDVISEDGHVHDTMRQRFIDGHLKAVWKAIDDGMDIRGYTCWSLLDNFEWFFGYGRRFGLTYVDYTSPALTRTPKDSFSFYANVIQNNGLSAQ